MYIEFTISNSGNYQAAGLSLMLIRRQLVEWSVKYNIPYKEKLVKNSLKVTFEDAENYTFFGLTWEPKTYSASRYRLVEPMARPPK